MDDSEKNIEEKRPDEEDKWDGYPLYSIHFKWDEEDLVCKIWSKLKIHRLLKQYMYAKDSSRLSEVLLENGYEVTEVLINELIQCDIKGDDSVQNVIMKNKRQQEMDTFISQWLLANENNVVFERWGYENEPKRKKILNFLLYHFND